MIIQPPYRRVMFMLTFIPFVCIGSERISIAVQDLASKGFAEADAQVVSNRLRAELFKTGAFRVMEREEMAGILKEQAFQASGACDDQGCIVEMGQLLGVSRIVAGSVGKVGRIYTISVRLIDVATGEVLRMADSDCQCPIEMVLTTSTKDVAEKLAGPLSHEPKPDDANGAVSKGKMGSTRPRAVTARGPGADSRMVLIPAGSFVMGSEDGDSDERPPHTVLVDAFYIDRTEVTQEDYARVAGKAPFYFKNCPKCPAETVSWKDADHYCKALGKRLPTEAEWEYAARAGSQDVYPWGDDFDGDYAWYEKNSRGRTMPVAQKKPNSFGLHDMLGSVWEWCADRYGKCYTTAPGTNPTGPTKGDSRVVRGGSWYYGATSLRVADRDSYAPTYRYRTIGFRCTRDKENK